MSEELNVIFHACMHGRTDIVQRAIQSVRAGSTNPSVEDSIAQLISTGRAEVGQTPLHVAATNFGPPKHHTKYKMLKKENDYSDRVFEVVRDKAELVGKQNALYERSGRGTPLHLAITSNNAFGTGMPCQSPVFSPAHRICSRLDRP